MRRLKLKESVNILKIYADVISLNPPVCLSLVQNVCLGC